MRNYLLVLLIGALLTMSMGTALAENLETNVTTTTGTNTGTNDTQTFQQALEQNGFTVQEGDLAYFDLIMLLEVGALPSAYGNNPTTKYLIYSVPPAPGYEVEEQISKRLS